MVSSRLVYDFYFETRIDLDFRWRTSLRWRGINFLTEMREIILAHLVFSIHFHL